jgi:hypothetical protein
MVCLTSLLRSFIIQFVTLSITTQYATQLIHPVCHFDEGEVSSHVKFATQLMLFTTQFVTSTKEKSLNTSGLQ